MDLPLPAEERFLSLAAKSPCAQNNGDGEISGGIAYNAGIGFHPLQAHHGVVMPHPTDSLEALIQEIATRHGQVLSRDDPALLLHTIHQRLLENSLQAQQALLAQYQQELESLSTRWSRDARDKAERSLNAALAAGKNAMAQAMQENCRSTAASMRAEMDAGLERIAAALRDAQRVARLNLLAACLAFTAAALAAWAVWR